MWLLRSTHKHIGQDTLSEYLDGRLQGRDLDRVGQRLEECDACRQDLEELQATVAMVRQLPMETPRHSFVMSAPPPEPVRARPALALRAPNWVYAGAASIAALALAITVAVDATGGLSSDPLRRDVETTTLASAPASEETGVSGPPSGPGPAGETAAEAEVDARFGTGSAPESAPESAEAASESGNEGTAPASLAAVAPAAATADQTVQEQQAVAPAAATGTAPPPLITPLPEARSADGDASSVENQTAKALTAEEPTPVLEPAEPRLVDEDSGGTSVWWRVSEAAVGLLFAAFLAGLGLRWRASRQDPT